MKQSGHWGMWHWICMKYGHFTWKNLLLYPQCKHCLTVDVLFPLCLLYAPRPLKPLQAVGKRNEHNVLPMFCKIDFKTANFCLHGDVVLILSMQRCGAAEACFRPFKPPIHTSWLYMMAKEVFEIDDSILDTACWLKTMWALDCKFTWNNAQLSSGLKTIINLINKVVYFYWL